MSDDIQWTTCSECKGSGCFQCHDTGEVLDPPDGWTVFAYGRGLVRTRELSVRDAFERVPVVQQTVKFLDGEFSCTIQLKNGRWPIVKHQSSSFSGAVEASEQLFVTKLQTIGVQLLTGEND